MRNALKERLHPPWQGSAKKGRLLEANRGSYRKSRFHAHRGQATRRVRPQQPRVARELDIQEGHTRRHLLQLGGSVAMFALATLPSQAISMPQAFESAWSAIGGGPADLTFPEQFLGHWLAESTLAKVETPLGLDFVPNTQVVKRAIKEDLKQKIRYEVGYIKNKKGKVIIDRRFNTARLMNVYLGKGALQEEGISWNPDDPNLLSLQLPGGVNILTRVVRRSEEYVGADRINTSEYFEQVFETPGRPEPKVKASRCLTKYKWRGAEEAAKTGGPAIVATQVVSDYLTPYDGEAMMMRAQNKPVVVYTYSMSFRRAYGSNGVHEA